MNSSITRQTVGRVTGLREHVPAYFEAGDLARLRDSLSVGYPLPGSSRQFLFDSFSWGSTWEMLGLDYHAASTYWHELAVGLRVATLLDVLLISALVCRVTYASTPAFTDYGQALEKLDKLARNLAPQKPPLKPFVAEIT